MAKKNKKESVNYMDFIPVKNPDIEHETKDDKVVLLIEWKGFYHKLAQKFFHRPKVSDISLDEYGSFVWLAIDGQKTVYDISIEMENKYSNMEKGLSRLIKFLEIMKDNNIIYWKEDKKC